MEPLTEIVGSMLPLDLNDVDTDQMMPKQFLARTERTGWGEYLFHTWRMNPDFVLNDERFSAARILVAGANFGSGSSREQATWAVCQYGFEAVIAPSFSDIFAMNATQIGLLALRLPEQTCAALRRLAHEEPSLQIRIDLDEERVYVKGDVITCHIAPDTKLSLITGLDDLELMQKESARISAYEDSRPSWMPVVTSNTNQ